jgi:hypothetical protein
LGQQAAVPANLVVSSSVVPTLQAALDLAEREFADGAEDVTILVLPGHYISQRGKTTGAGKGRTLTITSSGPPVEQTVFDGNGTVSGWLDVQGRPDGATNLTISGLTVTHYSSAISLNGSRDDRNNFVSRVIVKDNVFDTIGQGSLDQGKPSTAVIRLVNGSQNEIVGNLFVHSRNVQECNLLHSIYVAHNSTKNFISKNKFQDACGDSIRFRDNSNDNLVQSNRFEDAWATSPVSNWFCDASRRRGCTKVGGECPALNNRLIGNELVAHRLADNGLTSSFGDISTKNCPAPAGAQHFIVQ